MRKALVEQEKEISDAEGGDQVAGSSGSRQEHHESEAQRRGGSSTAEGFQGHWQTSSPYQHSGTSSNPPQSLSPLHPSREYFHGFQALPSSTAPGYQHPHHSSSQLSQQTHTNDTNDTNGRGSRGFHGMPGYQSYNPGQAPYRTQEDRLYSPPVLGYWDIHNPDSGNNMSQKRIYSFYKLNLENCSAYKSLGVHIPRRRKHHEKVSVGGRQIWSLQHQLKALSF